MGRCFSSQGPSADLPRVVRASQSLPQSAPPLLSAAQLQAGEDAVAEWYRSGGDEAWDLRGLVLAVIHAVSDTA
jgi:hypothetical protein